MSKTTMVETATQTRYEQIKELGEVFTNLIKRGFIDVSIINRIEIYEDYERECLSNGKSVSAQYVADKHKCSVRHVYKVIKHMREEN